MRSSGAHQPEWGAQVDGHHAVPVFVGRRLERAGRQNPRGIHQHVDPAEHLERGGDDSLRRIDDGDICQAGDGAAARGPNRAGHVVQRCLVAPHEHD
jgi:hypothetical protein